ncbi:iron ABC transporter permease [Alkalilimnicola sp. S0819]|nr:iron ABC transporter permease [Alkalilimnicola sp. S0819]KAB7623428.1 iron ABC transporter permease [Alkalilimnicola sp. S0819]MPQ16928.1 iron chelate uptake ABC transporter family permease subunit [Alkalilimnicola sp. S0819]
MHRAWLALPLLALLALLSLLIALTAGSVSIAAGELWAALNGSAQDLTSQVLLELRLPRALTAFVTGGLLALAGALMQVLLRNPLADPYILGVSGGASVAALLVLLLGLGGLWLPLASFGGAMGAMLLVFVLSHGRGGWTNSRLLLTGVVLAAGWGALISFLLAVSPDTSLRGMLFWLMGDLGNATGPGWGALALGAGLAIALPLARPLNLLARGELQAQLLGVPLKQLRLLLFLLASLLTAVAVSLAGSIGFIGLVIPHLLRLLVGSDHRLLLPACVLAGGSLLVLADTLARTLLAPEQLPVGVLSAMIGVPLFLFLLRRGSSSLGSRS